jgi:PAS domain S-box-containing protein
MKPGMRKSGIEVVGDVPWGTHFALFYRKKEDLIDVLVPYFTAGLENNEYCMWVTAGPLGAGEARERLAASMPDFDRYAEKGQIDIIPCADWYTIDDKFDGERVLNGWIERLGRARERGFDGLRLTGNESWLDAGVWNDFIDYEHTVNEAVGQHRMIALCTYLLDQRDAGDVMDVVGSHQFALTRRNGTWKIIEDQEQKKTRKALRDTEASLARSQEIAHIGNWELDVATGEIERSAESYRIFGLAPGEYMITYEKFLDFVLPEERERVAKEVRWAIQTGQPYNSTFHIRRKDDEIRVLHSRAEPVTDASGRVIRLFGTNQDITERRLAEESLRTSTAGLAMAEQLAAIGYWDWDLRTNDVKWSDGHFLIFGYTPAHGRETYAMFRARVHPDDIEQFESRLDEGMKQDKPYNWDYRVVWPDGTVRYVHAEADRPFKDAAGKPVRWFGIVQDVTERRRVEDELKAAKARAELYIDLMGHDINNMHQIALGYLEMARDMHADGDLKEFIDKPMEVLQRSTQLIKNVRKLQQLQEGMLQTSIINVHTVLADVQREFGSAPEKSITLNMNGCRHCRVRANELLHDVFANLVSNAIKHTGDRSEVAIGLDEVSENGRHYCRVTVEDNGPGIPDNFKDKVFNRMLSGTDKAKGMGLGLYLVKSLVESYGGRVWAEDRVRGDHTKGAKFVVLLPVANEQPVF